MNVLLHSAKMARVSQLCLFLVSFISCGISVEDWTENDNPASSEFHNRTCEFYTGVTGRNKPISKYSIDCVVCPHSMVNIKLLKEQERWLSK